jgi:ubiquinone/menaquinone biosynthesis C-methylase UbiE
VTHVATVVDANRLWVDSPVRARAQELFEARELLALGGRLTGGSAHQVRALEIGAGRKGTGIRLALTAFGADRVDAVELHPGSVAAALDATVDLARVRTVEVGDARSLAAADGTYDAVFCYHLLHHSPQWRRAVDEAARVLRPGGRFYVCEMTARFVDSAPLRAVSRHPDDGDRPTPDTLAEAVRAAGLQVLGQRTRFRGWWTALAAVRP